MRAQELDACRVGVIAGTGALDLFETRDAFVVSTPWGEPSSPLTRVVLGSEARPVEAWMIQRHGNPHRIPPHCVNYRANISALKEAGVQHVIAINAVGGVKLDYAPGDLVLVDQIIDYTWGRAHTFSDGAEHPLEHVEFANPYEGPMWHALKAAAESTGLALHVGGCYGATQGPRLETAAEIRRMARDGCDVVGMTGMPEAGLAREAGLDYASIAVVANAAAGLEAEPISMDALHAVLDEAMGRVGTLLRNISLDA